MGHHDKHAVGVCFHLTDVIGTLYKAAEFGDLANNPLGACAMNHGNLANGENIGGVAGEGADVVLYYRSAVRDQAGVDAMICKSAGPMFVPLGNWGEPLDRVFAHDFECSAQAPGCVDDRD